MPVLPSSAAADQAIWTSRQDLSLSTAESPTAAAVSSGRSDQAQKAKEAGQQFEAMYLRQMLEEWMPKDANDLFGEGTAGSVWRSMLVDHMATTLAKTGTIGIAQLIVKPEADGLKGK